uniref:Uncharacterized protein n=1 Tax=Kalanchoe fedtschenkoi TaxID=63787 RepID=A0A7N0V376_KALFE
MVNSWVERATSDLLIGPDWAMNMEISVLLNSDPTQAKDVVKGLKKRLRSKNPKVLILALTLLETIVKNCGDAVHIHVAEKNVLTDMYKLVKKKTDFHVKEKILILIDTWQEAFGGARARYPQFYSVYQDLLRAGAVFPKRERPAPAVSQSQPVTVVHDLDAQQDKAQPKADFPSLSLTEIQNARRIMDVLAQMLSVVDPQKKESLREEVVVDLVDQCRTYKQRVVHLLHTTSDEALLCQGITLNEDLQQLLAKYQSLTSGASLPKERPNLESDGVLVSADAPLIDTGDDTVQRPDARAAGGGDALSDLFAIAAPLTMNGGATPSANHHPKVDLLSGDDFGSPRVKNSLALVPSEELRPSSPAPQQNALVLADFYAESADTETSSYLQQAFTPQQAPEFPQHQSFQPAPLMFSANGSADVSGSAAQYEHFAHANGATATSDWIGSVALQQPEQLSYGAQSEESLPRPPWEADPAQSEVSEAQYPQMQFNQAPAQLAQQHPYQDTMRSQLFAQSAGTVGQMIPGMYAHASGNQPVMNYLNGQIQALNPNQGGGQLMAAMFPPPVASMFGQQQYYSTGYQAAGYGQFQQDAQMLNQQMYGLSVRDNGVSGGGLRPNNSGQVTAAPSYLQPMKPRAKAEDSLFGDLVDLTKFRPGGKSALI